jgi:hypothetical protein
MSSKKGQSVLALVSERVISAKNLATLADTLQQRTLNPIQVHHLGFRWVVNNAGKLKSRSDTVKATKSVEMSERLLSPSDSVRGLMDAYSASEDKDTLKPEVVDLDMTIEISDEDSLEEGEVRDDSDEDVQFIEEVRRGVRGAV